MRSEKHLTFAVFIVILLVLISGCKDNNGDPGAPKTPFLGGTRGLEVKFSEGSPPDEVTDASSFGFSAIVSLKNLGEYDLTRDKVKVSLVGFLPSDFGVSDASIKNILPEGDPIPRKRDADGTIIEPVETFVSFPSPSGELNFNKPIPGNTPFIFRADVCYRYQTKAVSEICVLGDMVRVADDAICKPTGEKSVFSSGSPLQVTSFRESYAGKSGNMDKIQFTFDIADSGNGNVFDATTDADCPKTSTERMAKEDKVKVTVDTGLPSGGALNCIGLTNTATGDSSVSGSVKLINGKRTLTCTQIIPVNMKDFRKSVSINLDFNYLSKADKEVLVKHLLTG